MRCFIAIDLPEGLKQELARIQKDLRATGAHVTWARPEGIHLTLKFLGEIGEAGVQRVATQLQKAVQGIAPFSVAVRGLGRFPPGGVARVLWVGVVSPDQTLLHLQARVEEAMATLGFPRERRPYTPHLTLGRVRSARGWEALLQALEPHRAVDLGTFQVAQVHLMRSVLHPDGARYLSLARIPLKGDGTGFSRERGERSTTEMGDDWAITKEGCHHGSNTRSQAKGPGTGGGPN